METSFPPDALLAEFVGGWEIVLILAMVLILYGAKKLPSMSQGLGQELNELLRAIKSASEEMEHKDKHSGLVYEALTWNNRTAEFVYPKRSPFSDPRRDMILFVAQGFGVGRIPFAPGTFGSLVGLIWLGILLATNNYWAYLLGALAGVGLSVWLCGAAEKILKQKDPSSVVLDEIVAIPFCFLPWVTRAWLATHKLPALETFFTGRSLYITVSVFVLFRLFDIAKPWPIRQSQRLPGGWGVTIDDALAAIYVALLSLFFVA